VSRFLPDDLFVGVEGERLSFVRRNRGFNPRVVATFELPLASDFWDRLDTDWVSDALPTEIVSGTRASIVVADRLVRYFLVERPKGARSAAEIKMAAALRFEELYGESAHLWRIEMDLPPWACNFLACGLPEKHLNALQQLFTALRIPVRSIAPFGIEQWNRHGGALPSSDSCFIALAKDTAWLTLRRDRRWLTSVMQIVSGDNHNGLSDLIRREFARHGLQEQLSSKVVYIAGAVDDRISSILPSARRLTAAICPGLDQSNTGDFYLALTSVWPTCK